VHDASGLGDGPEGGDILVGVPLGGSPGESVLALGSARAAQAEPGNGYSYPLALQGVVVGCPFVPGSTHSPYAPPHNLESHNAVDLAVPVGTPVLAVADGTIGSLLGPLDSADPHLAGLRVHLDTPTEHFYYAHLSQIDVTPGEPVHKGQVIGLSGEAAGVAHLHFAEEFGDPAQTIGEGAACRRRPHPPEPW
jgi:murein DD-endopeptidase MepM/ murein hydrolase activator NlpD